MKIAFFGRGKSSRKHATKIIIGVGSLILVGVLGLMNSDTYNHLLKTAVIPRLPAFCYEKKAIANMNVTFLCSKPNASSTFVGNVTSSLGNVVISDLPPGGPVAPEADDDSDSGIYGWVAVAEFNSACTGYCNCSTSTNPIAPNSCPNDDLHGLSSRTPPPPVCEYLFRGKVLDDVTTIVLRKSLGVSPARYQYDYQDANGNWKHTSVASITAFHTDPSLLSKAQQECSYQSRRGATGTTSPVCSSVCVNYIPADAQVSDTGTCTTYEKVLKNPLPLGCTPPVNTSSPTPSKPPKPTLTPTPTPTIKPTPTLTPTPTISSKPPKPTPTPTPTPKPKPPKPTPTPIPTKPPK